MSNQYTIYKNLDADSMLEWRKKDADPYCTLIRNSKQLLFIHKHKDLKKKKRILEYGCAFGDLLALIKALNPKHDVFGIEIVKEIGELAGERIGKNRIFIHSCEKKVPLKLNSVDIIYSFDMVEHVKSKKKIRDMFKECNRLLKKNGKCIIVTPNFNPLMKLIYVLTGNKWMIDKDFHPNQYTKKILKQEVQSELKLIKIEKGYDLNFFTRILSIFGIYKHICIIASKKMKRK